MADRYRSWIEISLGRIVSNYQAVRSAAGEAVQVMPVVKADAYRHGAAEVSRALQGAGAAWLGVSSVEEGVALRQAGIQSRVLCMAGCLPTEREALLEFNLVPAIHSLDDLRSFDALAARHKRSVAYHLKIDTGLGRLGTLAAPQAVANAVLAARHARLEGLMTHFASSADYTSDQTERQIRVFDEVVEQLAAAAVYPEYQHLAATISLAYGRRNSWRNMVRVGHAIYGYISPARGEAPAPILQVRPALSWRASLVQVKDVAEGTLIGYGGMYRASRPMRIGVVAVGYADGYPHRLSNRGKIIAAGRLAPVLGAVSMDLITVDLTATPELAPGDTVTLLGAEGSASVDAHQMARAAGTISYAVLCGIGARVRRVYVG